MIHPVDITAHTKDITNHWRGATGDLHVVARAHFRGGTITAVTVRPANALTMCRAAAAFLLTEAVIAAIEAEENHAQISPKNGD